MKITDKRAEYSPLIEGGDMILFPDGRLYTIMKSSDISSELVALLHLGTGEFYRPEEKLSAWFNHPAHLRNHLNKHYPEVWQHIKNGQVEVIIHEKTYSGF